MLVLALSLVGCGPPPPDPAKELVNAAGGSKENLLRVLAKGADVNARSWRTFGWTPLISAIYHRREDNLRVLIGAGADVNLGDRDGRTPVSWAAIVGDTNVIRILLRAGANPRITDRSGYDAYNYARTDNAAAIREFLKTGSKRKNRLKPK